MASVFLLRQPVGAKVGSLQIERILMFLAQTNDTSVGFECLRSIIKQIAKTWIPLAVKGELYPGQKPFKAKTIKVYLNSLSSLENLLELEEVFVSDVVEKVRKYRHAMSHGLQGREK